MNKNTNTWGGAVYDSASGSKGIIIPLIAGGILSNKTLSKLLNIKELSELLSVKESTIYGWTHAEFVPFIKIGHLVRFDPSEIEAWLNKQKKCKGRVNRIPDMGLN